MSSRRNSHPAGGDAKRATVLESSSVLPHAFQLWRDDTELLFKARNAFQYLTGEATSVFRENEPLFGWKLESMKPRTESGAANRDLGGDFASVAGNSERRLTPASADSDIANALTEMLAEVTEAASARRAGGRVESKDQIIYETPDTDGFALADELRPTTSIDFYYRRVEAHIKATEARERREKTHDDKVDGAMKLLLSTLSSSVQTTLRDEIATRRLDLIWDKLATKCGPRSGNEGLAELEKDWATTSIDTAHESMTDFLQRLERAARKFDAYGPGWEKTDAHKTVLVRQALISDTKHWHDWKKEIRDADRAGESWDDLKTRLEKLAGEIRADEMTSGSSKKAAAQEKALATQREKIASQKEGGKPTDDGDASKTRAGPGGRTRENEDDRAARIAKSLCNLCGDLGHFARDCPWVQDFRAMKEKTKSIQSKAIDKSKSKTQGKPSAAPATADDESDESEVGCAACSGGDQEQSEPFEDWLESSQVADTATQDEETDQCACCSAGMETIEPMTSGVSDDDDESRDWLLAGVSSEPEYDSDDENALPRVSDCDEEEGSGVTEGSAVTGCSGVTGDPAVKGGPGVTGKPSVTDEPCVTDTSEHSSPAVECSAAGITEPDKAFIVDSGCSGHSNGDSTNRLEHFVEKPESISLGNAEYRVASHGRGNLGPLSNVMWAPAMSYSMVSVSALDVTGSLSIFGEGRCIITVPGAGEAILRALADLQDEDVLMTATLRRKLYHVDPESFSESAQAADLTVPASAIPSMAPYTFAHNRREIKGSYGSARPGTTDGLNPLQLLHLRTGHTSKSALLAGLRVNAFVGAQTTYEACKKLEIGPCEGCLMGGMRADSVSESHRDYLPLPPLHDIGMDPVSLSTITIAGDSVLNCGLCYSTKLMWVYPAKTDGDQVRVLTRVKRDFATPYGHTIRTVHSDSGSVFLSKAFQKYCLDEGITQDASAPYMHQHNLVEGSCIRVLLNRTRVLLADSGLPPRFAEYAAQEAVRGWNAMLHPAAETKSPLEKVTGKKPDISGFRPFGAVAYYFNAKSVRDLSADPRWMETASKGILLGQAPGVEGGYLVYPGRNRQVLVRKQVVVLEAKATALLPCFSDRYRLGDQLIAEDSIPQADQAAENAKHAEPVAHSTRSRTLQQGAQPDWMHNEPTEGGDYWETAAAVTRGAAGIGSRRAAVAEICMAAYEDDADETMLAGEKADNGAEDDDCEDRILSGRHLPKAPRSIREALASEQSVEWRAALDRELSDCVSGESYAGVDRRPARYMNSVMSFRVSVKADGSLKYRARLCPNGSKQVKGVDYDESFSPTVRKETVFMLMHVAAHRGWEVWHVDIGCAYKEAIPDLKRPMYMRVAKDVMEYGFSDCEFVQLLVNYWGTKDAGRKFYTYMSFLLMEFGLVRDGDDPCLYSQVADNGQRVLVLLFVDDAAISGGWTERREALKLFLRENFVEIKCELLSKFVGMQCDRDLYKKQFKLHLTDYARAVVADHVPEDVPGSNTPLFSTVQYRGLPPDTEKPVWDVVGKLRFMADSGWHELKVATSMLASGGATPRREHRRGAMKALQYVKQHQDAHELVLGGREPVQLFAYSDASYTPEGDSRYQYGYVEYLGPQAGAVTVHSKRSTTVSHSSAQSEIKAMSAACKSITADRVMLGVMGEPQEDPTVLYTDSQAGVDLVSNVFVMHPKCRHFNRDINHVRECVQLGLVSLVFVPTDDNPADILTKILGEEKHCKFTDMLLHGVGADALEELAALGWVMG